LATLLSVSEVLVVAVVWNIEIDPDKSEAFERFYGADGEWTALSRKSRSFLGSSFLRDLAHGERYLLVEYWSEMVVYERHLSDFGDQVATLEQQRNQFIVRMEALGVFSALDVPDRVGPTWSRRSG
jgi:quinol monooxygenase YgiN